MEVFVEVSRISTSNAPLRLVRHPERICHGRLRNEFPLAVTNATFVPTLLILKTSLLCPRHIPNLFSTQ